jgi:hypothetical protein
MTPESPADEVLIIEEQVTTESEQPAGRRRSALRIAAGAVLGSVGLSLAATAIARRLLARRGVRGQRRRSLLNMQPRVLVFAPSMTISLPFSGIVEERRGRPRPAGRGRAIRRTRNARRLPVQRRNGLFARRQRMARATAGR